MAREQAAPSGGERDRLPAAGSGEALRTVGGAARAALRPRLVVWRPPGRSAAAPVLRQMHEVECGATALAMVLAAYGRHVPRHEVRAACGVSRDGTTAASLVDAAARYGLETKAYRRPAAALDGLSTPFIAYWEGNHFVVVDRVDGATVSLNDPATGRRELTRDAFERSYAGIVLMMRPGDQFVAGGAPPSRGRVLAAIASGVWPRVAVAVGLGVVVVLATVAAVLLVVAAMSETTASATGSLVVAVAIAGLVAIVAAWLEGEVLLRAWADLTRRLSRRYMARLLRLPLGFLALRLPADLALRSGSIGHLAHLSTVELATAVVAVVVLVVHTAVVVAVVGAVAGAVTGLSLLVAVMWLRADGRARRLEQEPVDIARGRLTAQSIQTAQRLETLRAMGDADAAFDRWADLRARLSAARTGAVAQRHARRALLPLWLALGAIVVLGVSWMGPSDGTSDARALATVLVLLASSLGATRSVARLDVALDELGTLSAQVEDVMDEPGEDAAVQPVAVATSARAASLRLIAIEFGYGTATSPVLRDLDLDLPAGTRTALLGATGSGKSTLVGVAAGLLRPSSGSVRVEAGSPATRVVSVAQDPWLFAGTLRDNLTLWDRTIDDERVLEAIAAAEIADLLDARAGGLEARISAGGRDLSGGERQRLAVARALLLEPAILVLDDATSRLDPPTEARIHARLAERDLTCLVIADRPSAISRCDRVVILEDGHIVEAGPHPALRRSARYIALLEGGSS